MIVLGKDTGPYVVAYRTARKRPGYLFDRSDIGWSLTVGALGYGAGIGYIKR